VAKITAAQTYDLGGLASAKDQQDANIVANSMREHKSGIDAATEDVQPAGSAGDILQREVW
jgi:hypothetical protein